MTAALHPILAEHVPDDAHPVTCPLPDCGTTPIGRMWRDPARTGKTFRRWHSVTDAAGVVYDGREGYDVAHWVIAAHIRNDHAQPENAHARAQLLLACNRGAIAEGRAARGLKSAPPLETAECAECQTGLTLTDHGWRDEHSSNACPTTRQLCPHLCRPHTESPDPCGVCHGHGHVYDTHLPYIDTRTSTP